MLCLSRLGRGETRGSPNLPCCGSCTTTFVSRAQPEAAFKLGKGAAAAAADRTAGSGRRRAPLWGWPAAAFLSVPRPFAQRRYRARESPAEERGSSSEATQGRRRSSLGLHLPRWWWSENSTFHWTGWGGGCPCLAAWLAGTFLPSCPNAPGPGRLFVARKLHLRLPAWPCTDGGDLPSEAGPRTGLPSPRRRRRSRVSSPTPCT